MRAPALLFLVWCASCAPAPAPADDDDAGGAADNVAAAAEYCADLIACGGELPGLAIGECVELARGVGDDCTLALDLCSFPCEGFADCVRVQGCEAYGAK
jgi:hypothetical protein